MANGATCPAAGCDVVTAPGRFMCRRHWFGLPKPLRDEIWRTWRIVGENRRSDKGSDEKLQDILAYRRACAGATAYWQDEA